MVIQTPILYAAPPSSGAGFGTAVFIFLGVIALFAGFFFWWKYQTENTDNKKLSNPPLPYE